MSVFLLIRSYGRFFCIRFWSLWFFCMHFDCMKVDITLDWGFQVKRILRVLTMDVGGHHVSRDI